MRRGTKRLVGGLALLTGAVGAVGVYLTQKNHRSKRSRSAQPDKVWARPGMIVTFRAELMPGREKEGRTFRVKELLPSGRVLLHGVAGEHAEKEFESIQ